MILAEVDPFVEILIGAVKQLMAMPEGTRQQELGNGLAVLVGAYCESVQKDTAEPIAALTDLMAGWAAKRRTADELMAIAQRVGNRQNRN